MAISSALRCHQVSNFDAFLESALSHWNLPWAEAVHGKGKKCSKHGNIGDLRHDAWRKRAEQSIRASKPSWGKWLRSGNGSPRRKRARKANWPCAVPLPTRATRHSAPAFWWRGSAQSRLRPVPDDRNRRRKFALAFQAGGDGPSWLFTVDRPPRSATSRNPDTHRSANPARPSIPA
jgi:hypothetical protein